MKIVIQGRLAGLNEYIDATRRNKYLGATMKRIEQAKVGKCIPSASSTFLNAVHIRFCWYEKDKRRDIDNISFAKKFILDALVDAGVLKNDTQRWVVSCQDQVFPDAKNPRIEVTITDITTTGIC